MLFTVKSAHVRSSSSARLVIRLSRAFSLRQIGAVRSDRWLGFAMSSRHLVSLLPQIAAVRLDQSVPKRSTIQHGLLPTRGSVASVQQPTPQSCQEALVANAGHPPASFEAWV